jgi:hypothetical protein
VAKRNNTNHHHTGAVAVAVAFVVSGRNYQRGSGAPFAFLQRARRPHCTSSGTIKYQMLLSFQDGAGGDTWSK